MLGLGIVMLAVAIAIVVAHIFVIYEETVDRVSLIMALCCLIAGTFIIGREIYKVSSPTAIEVYQGKTTLEITYQDGVAIDSVVVFKK